MVLIYNGTREIIILTLLKELTESSSVCKNIDGLIATMNIT